MKSRKEHRFHSPEYVRRWAARAERKPERDRMLDHIAAKVVDHAGTRILELGLGPGFLALLLLRKIPGLNYVGIDYSLAMIDLAAKRLDPFMDKVELLQLDLRSDWTENLPHGFDVVLSHRAIHDLGDDDYVRQVYQSSYFLLGEKGLFLNADLIASENWKGPGKLTVREHLDLLEGCGFSHLECSAEIGRAACITALKP